VKKPLTCLGLLWIIVALVATLHTGAPALYAQEPAGDAVSVYPPAPTDEGRLGTLLSVELGEISPAYTGCGGVTAPVINGTYEQEVVELVNAERAAEGLPPLKRVTELGHAARYYATDMAQDNYFPGDHNTYDRSGGSLVQVCTWVERIQSFYSGWQMLAENIAAGQLTPEDVMSAWMGSAGHMDNIFSSNAWEIGVGYYAPGRYWVQDFGRRNGIYPVIINQEAATTDSANVSLYIYGQGTWSEMRLRNDDGSWTAWQPFQSTVNWTLNGEGGEHTVWVEMRNGSQTELSSDTITLNESVPNLSLSTNKITLLAEVGSEQTLPSTVSFAVNNDGGDVLHWTAGDDAGWLVLGSTSGDAPASVEVWVDNSGGILNSLGEHTATITVTATNPDAVNTPQTISVTLNVVEEVHTTYLPLILR